MLPEARRLLKYWLPAIGWMFLIFVASTDLMSAEHTSRFIAPFLRWLNPDISPASVLQVQFAIRKAAHVTEYALLGALFVRACRGEQGKFRWRAAVAISLAVAASCAALDEFHQSFVASRTGSPVDVVIDVIGATIGVVYWSIATRKGSRAAAVPLSEAR